MANKYPILERDISWLSFNHRVLQEAMDPSLPLFERVKFLAIYSSNLDEFFRVRMSNHRNLIRIKKKTMRELDISPKEMVRTIQRIVNRQQEIFSKIFEQQLVPKLEKEGIVLKRRLDLKEEERKFVERYFEEYLLPYVQPVLLVKNKIRPFLNNGQLYLAIMMTDRGVEDRTVYGLVKIPSDHLPRFIPLPTSREGKRGLIMLDDVVRHNVSYMFPGYDIQDTFSIKLTRDAEIYIDDEFKGDLLQKIKEGLNKRHVGPASRFVYDREMPKACLDYLMEIFELEKFDLLREGRYHNNLDFFKFPDFGLSQHKYPPQPALAYPRLEAANDYWAAMRERDHLLHPPYHDYESVVRFFEEAAKDPLVTHIKIVQYRVARRSRIMNALMDAVANGKQVSVFIEVKARFDEEANLKWGERLAKAGVHVHYSFPGVKVHAKLAFVRRIENGAEQIYNYLATGNFHEDTAKVYSDFGIFTTDERITSEVAKVFHFLETEEEPLQGFKQLLVGQFNLRRGLEALIDYEIQEAKAGRPASMILKMNSLQDAQMIEKIYQAGQAGVEVKLIIRGICCLLAGQKGISDHIHAISIVDRYLEHARVFSFHHGGEKKMYLSSADFMTRNLSHRVEVCFPVLDPDLQQNISDLLQLQLQDNVKARLLSDQQRNPIAKTAGKTKIRSQEETYYYLKRQLVAKQQATTDTKPLA